MKRDWDVMRDVLLEVEALSPAQTHAFQYREIPDSEEEGSVRSRHAFMLRESGYLKGIYGETMSDGSYLMSPELTMNGADLLDAIRDPRMWAKVKQVSKEKGVGIAFDTVKALIGAAVKAMLD